MAVALERNHGLQKLDLSGNPLGQSGGRALAKAMRCCQREDSASHRYTIEDATFGVLSVVVDECLGSREGTLESVLESHRPRESLEL